ncbi:hypothetical protein BDV19DRAFT_22923 [Aspergillus venezuelensis]
MDSAATCYLLILLTIDFFPSERFYFLSCGYGMVWIASDLILVIMLIVYIRWIPTQTYYYLVTLLYHGSD